MSKNLDVTKTMETKVNNQMEGHKCLYVSGNATKEETKEMERENFIQRLCSMFISGEFKGNDGLILSPDFDDDMTKIVFTTKKDEWRLEFYVLPKDNVVWEFDYVFGDYASKNIITLNKVPFDTALNICKVCLTALKTCSAEELYNTLYQFLKEPFDVGVY